MMLFGGAEERADIQLEMRTIKSNPPPTATIQNAQTITHPEDGSCSVCRNVLFSKFDAALKCHEIYKMCVTWRNEKFTHSFGTEVLRKKLLWMLAV
jgi:hypothetical protein